MTTAAGQALAWLAARGRPACGLCAHLKGPPIDSGLEYCTRWCVWRWPGEEPACGTWERKTDG